MATPSIVLVPDRYKAGKLYSQLPDDGSVDFDVTRATTAYRTNANGILESVANDVPRLDYPSAGGCPSLLVEPAATNLLLRSEEFDNAYWTKTRATILANNQTSPDGYTNADKLVEDAISGTHFVDRTITGLTASAVYSFSIFVKKAEREFVNLQCITNGNSVFVNLNNGVINIVGGYASSAVKVESYSNSWYRITVNDTPPSTILRYIVVTATNSTTSSYTGDGTSGIFIWGAQLETGSVATSYIPTVSTTQTRNADVISKTGVSALIGQTQGTVYAEFNVSAIGVEGYAIRVGTTSFNNTIAITRSASNNISALVRSNGANTFTPASFNAGLGIVKVAIAYANADFALYINGSQIATSTASLSFAESLAAIRIGSFSDSLAFFNDRVRAAAIYTERLPNAELAALTTL